MSIQQKKAEKSQMISGGQAVIDALLRHQVDRAFCVPGESYLDILDAGFSRQDFRFITTRQEGSASFMAEAHAKLTGKTSVLMVTRGPGACNASIGIHTAFQDSSPMVVIVGDVARPFLGREAFQEIDFPSMFMPIAKWSTRIMEADRIPEIMDRAFEIAESGRKGPVVISIPEDVLADSFERSNHVNKLHAESKVKLQDEAVHQISKLLSSSKRPVILAGSSGWSDEACHQLDQFASQFDAPLIVGFRRQDLAFQKSQYYAGEIGTGVNTELVKKLKEADCVINLGARLSEIPSQDYTLFHDQALPMIFCHSDPVQAHVSFKADVIVQMHPSDLLPQLLTIVDHLPSRLVQKEWRDSLRQVYEKWSIDGSEKISSEPLFKLFRALSHQLPQDTIITNDAGNFSGWGHRFLDYGRPRRQLAPVNGAMGYAVPSAIAAKLQYPNRAVLSFAGDGGFMMTSQELATAKHYDINPVFVVMNNGMYGTIRMHQEKHFPGRVSATSLTNPDFKKLGEAYGCYSVSLFHTQHQEILKEILDGFSRSTPSLIEIKVPSEIISTASLMNI